METKDKITHLNVICNAVYHAFGCKGIECKKCPFMSISNFEKLLTQLKKDSENAYRL